MQAQDLILPALKAQVDRRAWTPWRPVSWKAAENPDRSVFLGLLAWLDERNRTPGERRQDEEASDIRG